MDVKKKKKKEGKEKKQRKKMSLHLFIILGRFVSNRSHPLPPGRFTRALRHGIPRVPTFFPNYGFAGFITRLIALVKDRVVRGSDGNCVMRDDRVPSRRTEPTNGGGAPSRPHTHRRSLMTLNQRALSMRRHGARLDYFPPICTHLSTKPRA